MLASFNLPVYPGPTRIEIRSGRRARPEVSCQVWWLGILSKTDPKREPPRLLRRPFYVSPAAMAGVSSCV
jgi:hypothetical protein